MGLQRRLPKRGFSSWRNHFSEEVRLNDVVGLPNDEIDLGVLCSAGLIHRRVRRVKIILKGDVFGSFRIGKGIVLTKGVRGIVETLGG
uniref:50S ribosomal protein L15 n=1 Tax=Candidatus Kentrum sp. MB TaxID=2138164 RepID=A0A450XH72_9GAMM|nr:MAG: large subunit ribosomal protein L15 [Candidatus Kentron sp. MB]VFK32234.1 MAG: large subunit ribosomal protein L15 [Candidatus Kentron sp. MB]VFK75765.1 MAG: large subunit ribosomal protein L15 [Candidatus Kentron sp. MB]